MNQSFEVSKSTTESQEAQHESERIEAEIKRIAKQAAKKTRKKVSTIKMPFTKEIPYEVEKNIEVEEGFFIFKTKKIKKIMEQRFKTTVEYKDVLIDGWVLKTYYENCDTVVNGNRISQDVAKWFYVLKRNGDLSVLQIGYVINAPKTSSESVRIYRELTEEPMTFDLNCAGLYSAYEFDFKPIKWENQSKFGFNEKRYFRRNYATSIGKCEAKGQSEEDLPHIFR